MRKIYSRDSFIRSTLATAASLASLVGRASAQASASNLRVIVFGGISNLPLWVALAKGQFARENLAVTVTPTTGSVYLFTHLSAGDFDIAHSAVDNAIAYDEGQGGAALPNPADFFAFMGGDNGFLHLIARPEISSYAGLKGKTLAVDALTTGFAFVLRRMLELGGLREGDYKLEAAGGTLQRYEKLMADGTYAATLLIAPYDLQARAKGFNLLGNATDALKRYQGISGLTTRAWAAKNPDLLVRYIRAYSAAVDWIYDPANKDEVIRLIADNTKVAPEVAAGVYAVAVSPTEGLAPKAKMDIEGLRTVLALRSLYGTPHATLTDPLRYYDDQYYRKALG